jgi:hypothetical protein
MRNLLFVCTLVLGWPAAGAELQFSFGDLATSGSLTNFHSELLGGGLPPAWKILPGEAPSAFGSLADPANNSGGGSALAQTSQDATDERFPMYIYGGDTFRNFRFATQFKIVSGVAEQMAGLVFRYQNPSNFYIVRIDALAKNLRYYKVVNSGRYSLVTFPCNVMPGTWHQLGVQCDGTQITISLDNRLAMPQLTDTTFTEGRIGFWTKSDTVSYFANARVDYTPVIPAAQTLVDNVMRDQPRILGLQIYTLNTNDNTTSILASKEPSEKGKPGTDAELAAIRDGTVSFARSHDAVYVTLPLHDRNGDFIAAVRLKLKTFFGETQDNAVNRATIILKMMQQFGVSADDLAK